MEIESEVLDNGILLISLDGRMNLKDIQEFEQSLRALVKGHHAVIIDLSGLDYLYSMGLRSLIKCAQMVQLKCGRLVLMAPSKEVLAVLTASGASTLMPICRNRAEAIAAVRS